MDSHGRYHGTDETFVGWYSDPTNPDDSKSTEPGNRTDPKSVPRYMPTNILVILGVHAPSKMPRRNRGPVVPTGEDGPYTSEGERYALALPELHGGGNRYETEYPP